MAVAPQNTVNPAAERHRLVAETIGRVRLIERNEGITRESIGHIRDQLVGLAAHAELFDESAFPARDGREGLYLLSEDPDHRFALYLNMSHEGRRSNIHNHGTWAAIAGVQGEEENTIFRRTDDGSVPGRAAVEKLDTVIVRPGNGIAFMPDDIHCIHLIGPGNPRHFHLYGISLEHLPGRWRFDPEAGSCALFPGNAPIIK